MKLIIITLAFVLANFNLTENWKVKSGEAKVTFTVKGPFGTVHGSFGGLKANIEFDDKHPEKGSLSASVDVNTINTGIGLRNSDLKKEKYFNADKYPQISFKSKSIEKGEKGFKAEGTLTMKDVSKPVSIPFTFTANGSQGVFKGDFEINREDFNIGSKGGSIGDKVSIHLEVPATK
jgi:polyisoprenoid-binding protein YceI